MMDGEHLPIALGIIRDVAAISYEEALAQQIEDVRVKKPQRSLMDVMLSESYWEVN